LSLILKKNSSVRLYASHIGTVFNSSLPIHRTSFISSGASVNGAAGSASVAW